MKLRLLSVSICCAALFAVGALSSEAQTDAQLLNTTAGELRKSLPEQVGDVEIFRVITYCPSGCDQPYQVSYLTLDGRTRNFVKSNVNFPQIQQSLKSSLVSNYCIDPLRQRNINLSINVLDMNNAFVGTVAISPTDCPVTVNPTPTPISQTNTQIHEVDVDFTNSYSQIWNDNGSGSNSQASFWRPNITFGWSRVGHHISRGYGNPRESTMIVRPRTSGAIADPVDFTLVWTDAGSGANQDGSVWRPICPTNYKALGDVTSGSHAKPATTEMVCVHQTALVNANPGNPIWDDSGSGATVDFGSWAIDPPPGGASNGLFFGAPSRSRPVIAIWAVRSSQTAGATPTPVSTPSTVASGAAVEDQFWDAVKNSNRPADFQNYLTNFPNGKYAALARLKIIQNGGSANPTATPTPVTVVTTPVAGNASVEEQYWDAVKNSSRSQDFQGYLDSYPSGKYVSIARLKISQLGGSVSTTPTNSTTSNPINPSTGRSVEDQYWDSVKASSRVQDFQSYLSSYPNGQYAALARLKIGQLGGSVNQTNPIINGPVTGPTTTSNVEQQYWDAIKNSTSAQDFQSYLNDYPNGQFAPIARLKIQQFQGGGITTNPSNSNAEEQYWNVISSSQRAQDFQGYLSNYPNGKYSAIARLKISQLGGNMTQTTTSVSAVEDQYWNNVKNSNRVQDFQSYLNIYPNGVYSSIARLRINQLRSPNNSGTTSPNNPSSNIPVGTNNQSRGDAILAKAQIGSMNELLGLTRYWIMTEPGDLDSKTIITDELRSEYPQLTAAVSEQDAEFFILFAMVDQATGAKIIGNTGSANQTQVGQLLVFRSLPSNTNLPNIRILFRVNKTRFFNNSGGTFNRHPATNATRDFVKELKKINF